MPSVEIYWLKAFLDKSNPMSTHMTWDNRVINIISKTSYLMLINNNIYNIFFSNTLLYTPIQQYERREAFKGTVYQLQLNINFTSLE